MTYDGGKNGEGVYHKLINQMPPHRVFIEAFFGSGAITRRKKPAELNVGIELDAKTLGAVQSHVSTVAVRLLEGDALLLLPVFSLLLPLANVATEDVLCYLDPPYLLSTRSCQKKLYRHELTTPEEHARLLDVADALPCLVMLSGYWSEQYARRLAAPKWRVVKFTAGSRGGRREECVWLNFPEPEALHDYSFLGEDNTDRQRIKRKIENRVRLLRDTPALERAAILEALHDLKTPASTGYRIVMRGCTRHFPADADCRDCTRSQIISGGGYSATGEPATADSPPFVRSLNTPLVSLRERDGQL